MPIIDEKKGEKTKDIDQENESNHFDQRQKDKRISKDHVSTGQPLKTHSTSISVGLYP